MAKQLHQQKILLVGAGAVGSAIATWLAPKFREFYILDQGPTLAAISDNGVSAYLQHHKDAIENTQVKTIERLEQCPVPDIILLCVKNYSLDGLSKAIVNTYGSKHLNNTVVVGLQNGVENQQILPNFFKKIVYGIISFNAWLDSPGVAGYQAKGPFIFGTPDNENTNCVRLIADVFNQGVHANATIHFQDAALSKMIINLTNSFTTLMGLGYRDIDDPALFQKILSQLTYEGVKVARASGYQECKIGDIPSWFLIGASARLPQFLTRRIFEKNVKKMVVSSMAQDIIQNGRSDNELESINGHILALAKLNKVDVPYNQAIYELCKQAFSQKDFRPISVTQVWQQMGLDNKAGEVNLAV